TNRIGRKFWMFEDAHADGRIELRRLSGVIRRSESRLSRSEPKFKMFKERLERLEREVRKGYRSFIVKKVA
ncbi:hypothetical protein, partial [Arachidicoccus sp.]|uniref:hypothetical protein n=1 Tax=Arachidicoccus sp. TaxID=1872624 RepID=UPI003D1DA71A